MFFPAAGAIIVAGSYAIAFAITLFLTRTNRYRLFRSGADKCVE